MFVFTDIISGIVMYSYFCRQVCLLSQTDKHTPPDRQTYALTGPLTLSSALQSMATAFSNLCLVVYSLFLFLALCSVSFFCGAKSLSYS